MTFQSKIVSPSGTALEAASVNFRFTILDSAGTCVLYVEDYANKDMTGSEGVVAIPLGSGTKVYPPTATSLYEVFNNSTGSFNCQAGGTMSPTATDNRQVVMQFNDGSGWQTLPQMAINAVPFANYATRAESLGAYAANAYLRPATLPTCTATQAITWDGSTFTCMTPSGGGGSTYTGVTSIANASGDITLAPAAGTGSIRVTSNTPSTSTTTGAVVITGGVGVSGAINAAGNIITSGSVSSTSILSTTSVFTPQLYGTSTASGNINIDGTSDVAKGKVLLSATGGRVGIGTAAPIAQFHAYKTALTGGWNVNSSGTTVTGIGTNFLSAFEVGDQILAQGQTKTITAIASNTSLTVNSAFTPDLLNARPTRIGNIFNNGAVGIGTTAPTALLDVVQNGNEAHNSAFKVVHGDGSTFQIGDPTVPAGVLRYEWPAGYGMAPHSIVEFKSGAGGGPMAGGNFFRINPAAADGASSILDVQKNGTSILTVSGNTNVGIGTSTPSYKLDVIGDINVTGNFRVNGTILSGGGGGPTLSGITNISNSSGDITLAPAVGTGAVQINSGAASTSPTTGALIVSGGIGVSGGIYTGGAISSGSTVSANTSMYTPQLYGTSTPSGDIRIDGTSNATKGNILLASTGGNVGIGTTNPSEKLDVVGNVLASNVKNYSFTRSLPTTVNDSVEIGNFSIGNSGHNLDIALTSSGSGWAIAKRYIIPVRYFPGGAWYKVQPISQSIWGTNDFELDIRPGTVGDLVTYLRIRRVSGSNSLVVTTHIEQRGNSTTTFAATSATASVSAPTGFFEASNITQYNGNVGIGTTSPTDTLTIYKAFNPTFKMDNGGTNSFQTVLGSNGVILGTNGDNGATNADLVFAADNATSGHTRRMTIKADTGNVGIGTSSPAYALSVSGDVNVTGNFRVNGVALGGAGGSSLSGVSSISNASGDITLSPIASSGSVRVNSGTASSSSSTGALVVTGGVGVSGAIYSGGAISSGSTISANTSMYTPQLYGTSTPSGDIRIDGTSNATKGNILLASTGGKVGIGTTTAPTATLTVEDTTAGAGYTLAINGHSQFKGRIEASEYIVVDNRNDGVESMAFSASNYSPSNGTGSYIQFETYNNGYNALVNPAKIHGVMVSGANGNEFGDLYFSTLGTGTTTEKVRIKGDGKVGIGTSTPQQKLDVIGAIRSSLGFEVGPLPATSTPAVFLTNDMVDANDFLMGNYPSKHNMIVGRLADDHVFMGLYNDNAGGYHGLIVDDTFSSFYGFTYDWMNPISSGNAGQSGGLWARDGEARILTYGERSVDFNANLLQMYGYGNSDADAPTLRLLHRKGTYAAQSNLTTGDLMGDFSFINTQFANPSGGMKAYVAAGTNSTYAPTRLEFFTSPGGTTAPSTRMAILADGKVGVGTTSPTYALSVSGDVNVTGNFRVNGTVLSGVGSTLSGITNISNASGDITLAPAVGTGAVQINSGAASTSPTTGALIVSGGIGVSGGIYTGGAISSGSSVYANTSMYSPQLYGTSTPSGNILIDGTSNATKGNVLLSSAGGSVGIGTTTPSSKLSVEGDINIPQTAAIRSEGLPFIQRLPGAAGQGYSNVYVGSPSPNSNAAAAWANTAVGMNAGDAVTDGYANVFVGWNAGTGVTTGADNTLVGMGSGSAITTGYRNIAMGPGTLGAVTTSWSNVAIGVAAGDSITGSNNIVIGDNVDVENPAGGFQLNIGDLILGDMLPSSRMVDINGSFNMRGTSTPPTVSDSNEGKIYYNSATNKFRVSENGGAYANLTTTGSNVIASGGAVDLSLSNTHVLQSVGGSTITISNMVTGGSYTIILHDQTSRTYSFAGCANTKFSPASGATTASTDTIFGLTTVYIGGAWYCYVTWVSGFQ